jgi:hypothetical protein
MWNLSFPCYWMLISVLLEELGFCNASWGMAKGEFCHRVLLDFFEFRSFTIIWMLRKGMCRSSNWNSKNDATLRFAITTSLAEKLDVLKQAQSLGHRRDVITKLAIELEERLNAAPFQRLAALAQMHTPSTTTRTNISSPSTPFPPPRLRERASPSRSFNCEMQSVSEPWNHGEASTGKKKKPIC